MSSGVPDYDRRDVGTACRSSCSHRRRLPSSSVRRISSSSTAAICAMATPNPSARKSTAPGRADDRLLSVARQHGRDRRRPAASGLEDRLASAGAHHCRAAEGQRLRHSHCACMRHLLSKNHDIKFVHSLGITRFEIECAHAERFDFLCRDGTQRHESGRGHRDRHDTALARPRAHAGAEAPTGGSMIVIVPETESEVK